MSATFESVGALRDSILAAGNLNAEYAKRMLHAVPEMGTVKERIDWLVKQVNGKAVLDIGCGAGPVAEAIRKSARVYYGVDLVAAPGCEVLDIDHRPDQLPKYEGVELILIAEILEHLANPGYFLLALSEHYPNVPLAITVPNAGAYQTHHGAEVVNADHVAWYSYTTLKTLLRRYGYKINKCSWYNGEPHKAEGLLVEASS